MSFNFGSPASAPVSTGSGFSFGAKPATTGFGTPATPQTGGLFGGGGGGFGNPAPALGGTGGFNFGSNAAAATSASTGLTFGAPATSTAGTGFGLGSGFGASSLGGTGTSFGTPGTGFGATGTAFGTTGMGIGGTAATFGTPGTAFGATGTGLGGTGTAFGASGTGTGLGGTGTGLGGTGTGLGGTATGLTGFSFGSNTTASNVATTAQGLNFGGGLGSSLATTSTGGGLFGNKFGTTTTPSLQPSTTGPTAEQQPKLQALPNELAKGVEGFKEFLKQQKQLSSEVMRATIKPLRQVQTEMESVRSECVTLAALFRSTRGHSRRLRGLGAAALAAAEEAHRTKDTPAGLDIDSGAPPSYVLQLADELELQLKAVREHIDAAEHQMQTTPKQLTQQELSLGLRRMHEWLVALAGRLHALHADVARHREQYLSLRRHVLKDPTDVFARDSSSLSAWKSLDQTTDRQLVSAVTDPRLALSAGHETGPTPFSILDTSNLGALPLAKSVTGTFPSGSFLTSPSPSAVAPLGGAGSAGGAGLQLQRPPKRGKH